MVLALNLVFLSSKHVGRAFSNNTLIALARGPKGKGDAPTSAALPVQLRKLADL
jgi:hypothetical protein